MQYNDNNIMMFNGITAHHSFVVGAIYTIADDIIKHIHTHKPYHPLLHYALQDQHSRSLSQTKKIIKRIVKNQMSQFLNEGKCQLTNMDL